MTFWEGGGGGAEHVTRTGGMRSFYKASQEKLM